MTVSVYRTRSSSVNCVNSLRCLQQPIRRPFLHLHRRPHSSKTVVSFSHFFESSKNKRDVFAIGRKFYPPNPLFNVVQLSLHADML